MTWRAAISALRRLLNVEMRQACEFSLRVFGDMLHLGYSTPDRDGVSDRSAASCATLLISIGLRLIYNEGRRTNRGGTPGPWMCLAACRQ